MNNVSLQRLICSSNQFGDIGIEILSDMFLGLKNLKELYLGDNNIKSSGVNHIVRVLEDSNTSIQLLNLCWNSIGDKGAEYISTMLRKNTSLKLLNLDQNHIGKNGCQLLKDAILHNQSLIEFSCFFNDPSFKFDHKIASVLKQNRLCSLFV